MKGKSLVALAVAVAVLVAFSVASFAGPVRGMGAGPRGGGMGANCWLTAPEIAAQLGLTPEQTQKLNSIRDEHIKEMATLRSQIASKRAELEVLLREPELNKEKIMAKQQEISKLQGEMDSKRIQYRVKSMELLTPEQRQQASTYRMGPKGKGLCW